MGKYKTMNLNPGFEQNYVQKQQQEYIKVFIILSD